ncbi:MAG: branched-chain amino acid ABC transporter permease [Fimbriimonadaceae bacterium]|nr:branched-chain amino acid ABC transporter permease [Alphaproteobacteria bacterium]
MNSLAMIRQNERVRWRRNQWIAWLAFAVVMTILPHIFTSGFALSIMIQIGIAMIFATSYNMLLGQGGMLSFGHAVYFGLGGFLAIHAMNAISDYGLYIPIALLPLVGGLAGLAFGIVFGSFSTRRAGTIFAMISLGIAELVAALGLIMVSFFGGEEGVSGDRTMGPELFGFDLGPKIEVYYLAATWTLIAIFLMYRYSRTPVGRMSNAVRDNPERAEFIGYSQRHVRFVTFAIAGFFAGVAGGLFAITYEILTEETLNAQTSGSVLLMTYVGGVGYFIGPLIGAVLLTILRTVLSNFTDIWLLYVGFLFVATVLFLPQGLTGILAMHIPAWRNGRLKDLGTPYLKLAGPVLAIIIGFIGLLEMTNFVRNTPDDERQMNLFWLDINVDSLGSWAAFALLLVAGMYGYRWMLPAFRKAWTSTNTQPEVNSEGTPS